MTFGERGSTKDLRTLSLVIPRLDRGIHRFLFKEHAVYLFFRLP